MRDTGRNSHIVILYAHIRGSSISSDLGTMAFLDMHLLHNSFICEDRIRLLNRFDRRFKKQQGKFRNVFLMILSDLLDRLCTSILKAFLGESLNLDATKEQFR